MVCVCKRIYYRRRNYGRYTDSVMRDNRGGKGGVLMTNRQWLEHLSDQELGMFLYSLEDYAHCDICADDGACKATDTNMQNCLGGIIKWLRQEKKE